MKLSVEDSLKVNSHKNCKKFENFVNGMLNYELKANSITEDKPKNKIYADFYKFVF